MPNRRTRLLLVSFALIASFLRTGGPCRADAGSGDPFLWLEDVSSPRSAAWVAAENAKTRAALGGDRSFASFEADAFHIRSASDKLALPSMIVRGNVYEFRRDAAHVRGIWRMAPLAAFEGPQPAWTTILDLDALAAADGKNWVWEGADCDSTSETRCLIRLSEGGEDATTVREFDLTTHAFVPGGFTFSHGKQSVSWVDDDTVLVAREWSPGQLTSSGYPYVLKRLVRGRSPDAAVEIDRGLESDTGLDPYTMQDADGHRVSFSLRSVSAFDSRYKVIEGNGLIDVPFPHRSSIEGLFSNRLLLHLDEAWTVGATTYPADALVSMELPAFLADPAHPAPSLVFAPGPRETFDGLSATRDALYLVSLDNVRGRVTEYATAPGGVWTSRPVAFPDDETIGLPVTDDRGTAALATVASFLQPTSIWSIDGNGAAARLVETAPARFDATRDVVQQREATSADGTRIPYFIVHRRDRNDDGTSPTILEAYGGSQISETPSYSGIRGKLWLERGGTYVLANIRGGGEFGPAWHEAGLKTHRQRIYDDFAAVARDLFARHYTSPAHLGIAGGSNGGLLMGVEMTQHPGYFSAVDIGVPLLDMLRFEKIAAGSSWTGEYGSVSVPAERAFLAKISPYRQLRGGVRYPEPFLWTTTKDDRVGPQHARKFAAKLAALNDPYLFFEQTEGGHGSGANDRESAELDAMQYAYFSAALGL